MRTRSMAARMCKEEDNVDTNKARPHPGVSTWIQFASSSRRILAWTKQNLTYLAHRRHARALRKQLSGLSGRLLLDVGMEDYERARKSDRALVDFLRVQTWVRL